MATNIFLGEPPADIKQWIIDHATPPGPAGHADTWYKYAGDTEWKTVSISGAISGTPPEFGPPEPTTQIPNVANVVALEIGTNVTSIVDYAFYSCGDLQDVTIGNGITSIGEGAFSSCNGLASVTIPDSVTSIGNDAFYSCGELTSVTIPDSVTSIGNAAFYSCTELTSMTIPDSVTNIGDHAFESCRGLASVTIGNSVTSIGSSAFSWCNSNLTSVTFLGKTLAQVQGMANYSWGIEDTSIINVA